METCFQGLFTGQFTQWLSKRWIWWCAIGLSEDSYEDDIVGVFGAKSLYTPSDIAYHLEPPVMVRLKDDSLHQVPDDMFRLESTPAGAAIYINKLDSRYSLQDSARFTFRVVAVDRARLNATATAVVEVTTFLLMMMMMMMILLLMVAVWHSW